MKETNIIQRFDILVMMTIGLILSGCGGGGGGGGSSSNPTPPNTTPVIAKLSVVVSDPGVANATLSYKWKSTDGVIVDQDSPTTTWTLPITPGVHFAYVLVANGFGGYTERRIAVITDGYGYAAVTPITQQSYVAPAAGVQIGNYYSGYVVGDSILSDTYDNPHFRTFSPDVLVYLTNVANPQAPVDIPAGGATAAVKTNVRGQYVIPGVTSQAALTTGGDAFNVNCSLDNGNSWSVCNTFKLMPDHAVNESNLTATSAAGIIGRFLLADKHACGIVSEFFGIEVTASAVILDQGLQQIGGPYRLSHEGDYSIPGIVNAAFIRISCEKNPPVIIPFTSTPVTRLATAKAPIVADMVAINISSGQFMPPPAGLPSDALVTLQGGERFLSYRGLDTRKGACEYYKSIGAVQGCDTAGNYTGNVITFDDWKRATRMSPYISPGVKEYTATYINQVDLNLTRNHHSVFYTKDDTSAYVCNHLGPKDTSQTEINAAIDNAIAGNNLVACVAMDHRISSNVNGGKAFTRFLIFGPDGTLLPSINLDGRSEKFVPGTCVVCHGGDKYAGKFPEDGNGFADIGAHFLPYDIGNFVFSDKPGLTRADQEEAIFQLNQNVARSSYSPAGAELIAGWYADGTHIMNTNYLPQSWQETNLPAANQGKGMDNVYHTLIAHSCRTCHVNMPEEYNFDHFVNTTNTTTFKSSTVCGTISNQWRAYSMPNSLVTFNRFWQSPAQIAAYETLMSSAEPCKVELQSSFETGDLVAGNAHTLNINSDWTLWARGDNSSGQLGNGSTTNSSVPVQVQVGADYWSKAAAGGKQSFGIKKDGSLWAWGDNTYGQLGINSKGNISNLPTQVALGSIWDQVATGAQHSLGLRFNGIASPTLWAWGNNSKGQLGIGNAAESLIPVQVGSDTWNTIAAGSYHTLAIRSDGTLWAWGDNSYGQLGDKSYKTRNFPVQIGTDNTWVIISAADKHSSAIKGDGTLWVWGDNSVGQLGDGTYVSQNQPIQVGLATNWQYVAAAGNHTIGTEFLTGFLGWGDNAFGQIGDNTTVSRSSPTTIPAALSWPINTSALQSLIGAGATHTTAWDAFSHLWAWGDNSMGQLGDGTTISHLQPAQSLVPPIIERWTNQNYPSVAVGNYYQHNLTVFNVNNTPSNPRLLTFSLVSKPDWVNFDTNSGLADTVVLSGTPTAANTYSVVFSVSDGLIATKYIFPIVVQ